MSSNTITIRPVDSFITVIALNRPDAANALNTAMALELKGVFSFFSSPIRGGAGRGAQYGKAEQVSPHPSMVKKRHPDVVFSTIEPPPDGEGIRAIILTGQGKHFCAGADLKERKGMDETAWRAQHHAFEAALKAILNCPIPVIAAVNGAAFGGGLELALACDFIYASGSARFALTEVTLGIMPGMGGTQNLPRRVGPARAKEIIYTGKPISAEEALAWGLVNRLCPPESLLAEAIASAKTIAANAPLAVKSVKNAINQGIDMDLDDAMRCELRHYETLLSTQDRHEGINAFNEKRKPAFTGT